jgi:hypothetical protein
MKLKSVFSILSLVVVLSLLGVGSAYAQAADVTITVSNFGAAALAFTLDGKTTTIAGRGGQMVFPVKAGTHEYKGVMQGLPEASGKVDLKAGEVFSLAAHLENTGPVFDASGENLDQTATALTWISFIQEPASTRAPLQPIPSGYGAIVFDNYLGAELMVDLGGDSVWHVPVQGRMQFDLPAGPYRVTASAALQNIGETNNLIATVATGKYTGLGFNKDLSIKDKGAHAGKDVDWTLVATHVPLP